MIVIKGKWGDGNNSAQISAIVTVYDNGAIQVQSAGTGELLLRQSSFSLLASDRIANTPRFLTFPNGTVLETDDNASVDQLMRKMNSGSRAHWVHLLESKKRHVLWAGIVVACIGVALMVYGFPAAAKVIATYLPQAVFDTADRQALAVLDRIAFTPSELPSDSETRIRTHFQKTIDAHVTFGIRLLFRKGGKIGPNAFALPGGTIVFTDELVALAEHDDELLGIMAHEIGHVVYQHAMRRMVQDSMLTFAFLALTGDASGVSELFLGLPVLMTELAYSREFEKDADRYALVYLQSQLIPPHRFSDILVRIDQKFNGEHTDQDRSWTGYLSTHPPTQDRIRAFQKF